MLGLSLVDGLVGDLDLGLVGVRLLVQADDVVEGDAVALDAHLLQLGQLGGGHGGEERAEEGGDVGRGGERVLRGSGRRSQPCGG